MEAVTFVKMLQHASSHSKGASRRHILRIANAGDYFKIARLIKEAKGVYKHLKSVEPLPLIRAFAYHGILPPAIIKKLPALVSIEDDIPITVHALPSIGTSPVTAAETNNRPFIPYGVRKLRIPSVWKRSLGERVRIGIIDTGVDYSHPDLQLVLSRGINLLNPRTLPLDDNGHGTHIAGTIAASGRGGMTGIAPRATIYPVKAFDHNGSAYVSDIIKGIDWCVQNRIHIINMSFGMKRRSQAMLEAVRNARRNGVIIVASSGNDGRGAVDYPARFKQTISVGAIGRSNDVALFSNRGKRIDVYAPGEKIMSTWPNYRYREMTGTSMATAHVTGIVALVLSIRPHLTPLQIKKLVAAGQLPIGGKIKRARGPGRIDAIRVFRQIKPQ